MYGAILIFLIRKYYFNYKPRDIIAVETFTYAVQNRFVKYWICPFVEDVLHILVFQTDTEACVEQGQEGFSSKEKKLECVEIKKWEDGGL